VSWIPEIYLLNGRPVAPAGVVSEIAASSASPQAEPLSAVERGYHQSDTEYIPDFAGVACPLLTGIWKL